MKAFLTGLLALSCALSMTACAPRSDKNNSSSMLSSSSVISSSSSSMPEVSSSSSSSSMSSGMTSDISDATSNAASKVEEMVKPTMSTDFEKIGALGQTQVAWGPGVQVDEQNRTTASDSLQEKYAKYGAYFIAPKDSGKFYFTFDEGYENGHTPAILDILKEKNVKGVFFVTGPFAKSEPELIQRMIDEGHIIGNHTKHHWNPTKKTIDEAAQDIRDLHDYMKETFNYEMTLYRPPEGAFSEQILAMAQQMGYTTLLWSFAYADWDPNNQMGYDASLARTEKFIHEGAIYLLHVVGKDNAEILGQLIDSVRAKGFEISAFDLPYIAPEA